VSDAAGMAAAAAKQFATPSNVSPCARKAPPRIPEPGEDLYVGPYSRSYRGNKSTGLNKTHTPHHEVQDAVSDVSHGQGVTINIRKDIHKQTRSFGKNADLGDNRKNLLAGVREMRRLLLDHGYDQRLVNQQLRILIEDNRRAGNINDH
jgi:hypothetical protein